METALAAFLGTIVGALSSILTTWLSQKNASNLQIQKFKVEQAERQNSFQRETLLELQDSIHDALRSVSQMHHADLIAFRKGNPWGKVLFDEPLSENERLVTRKVRLLTVRVEDGELRLKIKMFMDALTSVPFQTNESESTALLLKAHNEWPELNESIGKILRLHF